MDSAAAPLEHDVRAYLRALKAGGVALGLDRMRGFLTELGNPHERVPVIHVAGTNGKGSVAAMVESILRAAGWRTGLYISPHLVRLGERVQVNRQPLTATEIGGYVRELQPLVAKCGVAVRPSYFEFMTAVAFLHFARSRCDVAVIEVGMGGRLDATNVVMPEVAAITSVGLDHTEFLGRTIAAIAREKAGIIKPGRPVVLGLLSAEAEQVVRETAAAQGANVYSVAEAFGIDQSRYPRTNLAGDYQRVNAATSTLVAQHLEARWRVDDRTIATGLQRLEWPARWEEFQLSGRRVVLDTSHNEEGARALRGNLARLVAETGRKPIVVLGVLGLARAKPLVEVAAEYASELHLAVPRQHRASSYEELERLVPAGFGGPVVRDTLERLMPEPGKIQVAEGARTSDAAVPVVITGSIYLAGEARVRIDPSRGPLDDDLQDF